MSAPSEHDHREGLKLYLSERELWDECPAARDVLRRLAGLRRDNDNARSSLAELHDAARELVDAVERVGCEVPAREFFLLKDTLDR